MAKKNNSKKSCNNKCKKDCKPKVSKDCPDGVCPIKKPKKKTVAKLPPPETPVPEVREGSIAAKILAALKFWK